MELLYVWIDDYKNIKQQGFCLSAKYDIEYTPQDGTLRIEKRENYVANFWGEQITNLTAIVGENGAGKSSLLRFILGNITTDEIPNYTVNRILVYQLEGEEQLFYHASNDKNITFSNIAATPQNYNENLPKFINYSNYFSFYDWDDTLHKPQAGSTLYHNPFDSTSTQSKRNTLTTSALIRIDWINKEESEESGSAIGFGDLTSTNPLNEYRKILENHKINELIRNIDAIYSLYGKVSFFSFNFPRYISFNVNDEIQLHAITSLNKNDFVVWIEELQKSNFEEGKFEDGISYNRDDVLNKILVVYWKVALFNFLIGFAKISEYIPWLQKFFMESITIVTKPDIVGIEYVKAILNSIESNVEKLSDYFLSENNQDSIDEKITKQINQLREYILSKKQSIFKLLNEKVGTYWQKKIDNQNPHFIEYAREFEHPDFAQRLSIQLDTQTFNNEEITEFIALYSKSRTEFDFFNFEWLAEDNSEYVFSSGEQTFLSFAGRIKSAYDVTPIKDNTVLLIDEGELTLHPQWQREFIEYLVHLVNYLLKDEKRKNCQIILTTHSPLILSDIPKNNVIFLKKWNKARDEKEHGDQGLAEGNCFVVPQKDTPQTFGANIHTLLADSFFLDSTIGSFAEKKIIDLVKDIENAKGEDIEIENRIAMIGEPILKSKIEAHYNAILKTKTKEVSMTEEEYKKYQQFLQSNNSNKND